ncbi:MAG: NADH-quinone oxidoreductase subunit NuoK [Thermoflexales bacterium]|nr:NADH-quinone oxidoreductase subunit NuoK [Thermoflexales bacterium]MCS7323960.1 NADH-quinone oxidoreductase subunit NuoK [Thermoflexales bacterium]MCX7939481.1 NADH-quinone oxidoreductase subunit NuoK [Thermoflexales bacterium]MDW8053203.1 NADH-quinone oxidoreductase subunit NuoK [Anaerolineae bacterium]MDW8291854.1 NADH-quinone oxidoreductase subunit NuoK [Anaerolineae bacterium]
MNLQNTINGIPLEWYLIVAAALFSIGLYGVLARKNAVAMLMGVELMLNSVNLNLLAFWRYLAPESAAGLAFAAFVFVIAAAETAVGLALIIAVYRSLKSVDPETLTQLKL